MTVASFRAHKNGTDQTSFPDATETQITFGTEAYDNGNFFASNAWTPPAGKIRLMANVYITGTETNSQVSYVTIRKNNATFAQSNFCGNAADAGPTNVVADDNCSGSDVYTVFAYFDRSSGSTTVSGNSLYTWFSGYRFPTPVACFKANKNGTDQTGVVANTITAVTFGNELYDVGNYFASNAWTPPAGNVTLVLNLAHKGTIANGTGLHTYIYKNGSVYAQMVQQSAGSAGLISFALDDQCNGSDAYTDRAMIAAGSSLAFYGNPEFTNFSGVWLSA
jgi:hypothetical protein